MKTKERLLIIGVGIVNVVPILPLFCIILATMFLFPIWGAIWLFTGFNAWLFLWYTLVWLVNYRPGDKFEFDGDSDI